MEFVIIVLSAAIEFAKIKLSIAKFVLQNNKSDSRLIVSILYLVYIYLFAQTTDELSAAPLLQTGTLSQLLFLTRCFLTFLS